MLRVLLTNDDGVSALGLRFLYAAVRGLGDVHGRALDIRVSAPAANQSAVSHKLATGGVLEAHRHNTSTEAAAGGGYGAGAWVLGVSGTPVDSVRVGLQVLDERCGGWKPDIVLAGVNHGNNLGLCALYSGTVAAAAEGTLLGVPGVALSYDLRAFDQFDERDKRDMETSIAAAVPPLLRACFDPDTGACRIPKAYTLVVNIPNPLQRAAAAAAAATTAASASATSIGFSLTRLTPTALLTPYILTKTTTTTGTEQDGDEGEHFQVTFHPNKLQDQTACLADERAPHSRLSQFKSDVQTVKTEGRVSVSLLPLVPSCDTAAAYELLAAWSLFA